MSKPQFTGTAAAVAQVRTFTPGGTITAGDVNTLTATLEDGSTVAASYTALSSPTAATVSAGLIAAWAANATLAALATASGTSTVVLTAAAAGVPFNVAPSVTGVGTLTAANTTASSGPNDWNVAANFTPAAVPVAGDDGYLRNCSRDVSYGLNQSAVTLATLAVDMTMTGKVGTASAWFRIGATSWRIGDPGGDGQAGTGSPRVKIDFGGAAFSGVVVNSYDQQSADAGLEPVQLKGTHAGNELIVLGGRVGVATVSPSDVATLANWTVTGNSAVLNLGPGVTWTNGFQTAGFVKVTSGGAAFTQDGGTALFQGTGVVRALTVGGSALLNQRPLAKSISGVGRTGSTATATSTAHGYANGDTVYVAGAAEADFNGFKTISNVTTNTFDYTVPSTAPASATGTITGLKAIATLTGVAGGVADFSADGRDVAIATLVPVPGFTVKVNAARPNHLIVGATTRSGVATLKYE
jgi:hypothetical protein